ALPRRPSFPTRRSSDLEHVRQFPAPRLGLQASEILIEWGDRNVDLDVRAFLVERGNDLLHSGSLDIVPDSVIETGRDLGVLRHGEILAAAPSTIAAGAEAKSCRCRHSQPKCSSSQDR